MPQIPKSPGRNLSNLQLSPSPLFYENVSKQGQISRNHAQIQYEFLREIAAKRVNELALKNLNQSP